jgi:hypothetical protein
MVITMEEARELGIVEVGGELIQQDADFLVTVVQTVNAKGDR